MRSMSEQQQFAQESEMPEQNMSSMVNEEYSEKMPGVVDKIKEFGSKLYYGITGENPNEKKDVNALREQLQGPIAQILADSLFNKVRDISSSISSENVDAKLNELSKPDVQRAIIEEQIAGIKSVLIEQAKDWGDGGKLFAEGNGEKKLEAKMAKIAESNRSFLKESLARMITSIEDNKDILNDKEAFTAKIETNLVNAGKKYVKASGHNFRDNKQTLVERRSRSNEMIFLDNLCAAVTNTVFYERKEQVKDLQKKGVGKVLGRENQTIDLVQILKDSYKAAVESNSKKPDVEAFRTKFDKLLREKAVEIYGRFDLLAKDDKQKKQYADGIEAKLEQITASVFADQGKEAGLATRLINEIKRKEDLYKSDLSGNLKVEDVINAKNKDVDAIIDDMMAKKDPLIVRFFAAIANAVAKVFGIEREVGLEAELQSVVKKADKSKEWKPKGLTKAAKKFTSKVEKDRDSKDTSQLSIRR